MGLSACYATVEGKTAEAFRQYGRFVARHPWKIIIIVILVNCLLGIGLVNLNVITDVIEVYTPINSQARQAQEKVEQKFPDASGYNFIQYQTPDWGRKAELIVKPSGGDILDINFLEELKNLHNFVLNIPTSDENGNAVVLTQICARIFGECAVDGNFFFDDAFIAQVATGTVPFPYLIHPSRGPIYYEQLVGGANVSSGILQSAIMLLLGINLRTDSKYYIETAKNWQDSFIEAIETYHSDSFDIAFSHRDSISLELDKNIYRDLGLFTVTFTVMIAYACAATFTAKLDCVGQRCILGIGGVLAAGLAILAAFGLVCACGVDFISIVGVVPFLIIGIGVDDMFILLSGMSETNFNDDIETRIGDTMATSGISITITSLTDLLAFAVGATSVFLGVRNFCIYCAVAVVFCYINQASMFIACIAINEQRTLANRHFATCRPVPTKQEATTDGKSSRYIFWCTGQKPRDSDDVRSFLDKVPRWLVPKLVFPTFMKVIILISFAGYLAASIYGITQMREGVNLKQLVADDSYYLKFKNLQDDNFPALIPVSFIFETPIQYFNSDVQKQIEQLVQTVKDEHLVKDDVEINWLSDFKKYGGYDDSTEVAFMASLRTFLNITTNTRFHNDIIIDDVNNVISYSRIHVISESIQDSQDQGDFMVRMRDLASNSFLPVLVHSGLFIFFEQFNAILPQTLQTVGVAIAAVFLVTCIFMPHPMMLLLITVTVVMITTGIFGFLHYLNLALSSITMVQIIMSIGFSVDFCAHICHGYMISSGRNRQERTKNSVQISGAPIFHGAVSSILGVVVLAFGRSFITITFFKVMTVVLVFAIAHALLLLPVVLSLIGPSTSGSRLDKDMTNKRNAIDKRPENQTRRQARTKDEQVFVTNVQDNKYPLDFKYSAYGNNAQYQKGTSGRDKINENVSSSQRVSWYKNENGTYSITHYEKKD